MPGSQSQDVRKANMQPSQGGNDSHATLLVRPQTAMQDAAGSLEGSTKAHSSIFGPASCTVELDRRAVVGDAEKGTTSKVMPVGPIPAAIPVDTFSHKAMPPPTSSRTELQPGKRPSGFRQDMASNSSVARTHGKKSAAAMRLLPLAAEAMADCSRNEKLVSGMTMSARTTDLDGKPIPTDVELATRSNSTGVQAFPEPSTAQSSAGLTRPVALDDRLQYGSDKASTGQYAHLQHSMQAQGCSDASKKHARCKRKASQGQPEVHQEEIKVKKQSDGHLLQKNEADEQQVQGQTRACKDGKHTEQVMQTLPAKSSVADGTFQTSTASQILEY